MVLGSVLTMLVLFSWTVTAQQPIQIEVANQSGVAGYPIAAFGSGFGDAEGEVTILGKSAEITSWTSRTVQAIVPFVADGAGDLTITTADGQTASNQFTVYTINPDFLQPPTETYENVLSGRQAVIEGFEWSYCAAQPSNEETKPELFLSNYRCGYQGIVRSGLVVLTADSSLDLTASIAYRFSEPLQGDHVFQFMTDNNWYERLVEETYLHSVPETYHLEISADSTNGKDGDWQTLLTVEGNFRSTRTHPITIPEDSGAMWFRMRISDGLSNHTELDGKDFALRELRLYKVGGTPERPDSAAIYGDSLTADAFEALGPSGLPVAVGKLRDDMDSDLLFTSHGLSGQNSSGLENNPDLNYDIYDAFETDDAQSLFRYWFIAIGTNDAAEGSAAIDTANTNINQYAERLDQLVQDAVDRDIVPIVARIPDMDAERGGWGDLVSKTYVLNVIDAVAARHQLIPGPDFYTEFRINIETDNSSYFGDDGIHHVDLGGQRLINGWAESYVGAFAIAEETVHAVETVEAATIATPTPDAVEPTKVPFFMRGEPTAEPTEAAESVVASVAAEEDPGNVEDVNSAETERPLWQWITLFAVLLLLSFGLILFVFKRLGLI